ncbi:ParB/Srx family N-terminal domain-containing protein [Nocardia tengchongensis]|uniref:ParB/Srx family N-terminal domain-containing protein n=1 Tax=Nocardia tengchongensis TaxID=2055889 RepID=UPI003673CB33
MNHPVKRIIGSALAIAAIVAGSAGVAAADNDNGNFPCNPSGKDVAYCNAKVGDIVDVAIGDVAPTQPSVGYDEIDYKLGRYTLGKDAINKKFDDWCADSGLVAVASAQPNATLQDASTFTCQLAPGAETDASRNDMKTVVVGPHGKLYMADGHHALTSFWETADGGAGMHIRLKVVGNLSNLNPSGFWDTMVQKNWAWLYDNNDQPIKPHQLPSTFSLKDMKNDQFRGMLYFAKDVGYATDHAPGFDEFYWGRWLRAHQNDPNLTLAGHMGDLASYLTLTKNVSQAMVALGQNTQVSGGFTAGQLGALPAFSDKEFAKLSKPYSDAKPGKLAYMLAYKAAH